MIKEAPATREEFNEWMLDAEKSNNPLHFAVIDKSSGKVGGRQAFVNINPQRGTVIFIIKKNYFFTRGNQTWALSKLLRAVFLKNVLFCFNRANLYII